MQNMLYINDNAPYQSTSPEALAALEGCPSPTCCSDSRDLCGDCQLSLLIIETVQEAA